MSVVKTLAELIERLYNETDGYIDNPADAQVWYNRGYANGLVAYFRANGLDQQLPSLNLDAADVHEKDHVMEWFKAYHHGFEMGEREAGEVFDAHG